MSCRLSSNLCARAAVRASLIGMFFALTTLPASAQGTDKSAPMTPEAAGAVYDTKSKVNLTEERQRKQNRVNVAALPLDLAIRKVKGNGERKLVVFSDPDCPFCARLERTLKEIDNTTVYTFLFPIHQLHPDAARKARLIWCAPDRQKAWDAHFDSGSLPDNAGECANPVARTQALGASLKINATPTLIFADGSIVPGALPAERLESEFAKAEAQGKKLAAKK